jgi:hypothetical protein
MLWEGKPLRDIRENDIRGLVDSGLEEHLQLEYKSSLYDDNDRGRKEFLLDVCMFANASGGIILIGIPERRDEQQQPTGTPDPAQPLGIDVANPEATMGGYDARVMEAIEERLALESASVDVGGGRRVLLIRVPNSANKPHSVRHQGHIYFPSRRERQRYPMTVREIKELVIKTASRMQQASDILDSSFLDVMRPNDSPHLMIGLIPVFFEDFLVDVRAEKVRLAVANFSRTEQVRYIDPVYTFDGLERRENQFRYTVGFRRNGLLSVSMELPLMPRQRGAEDRHVFFPSAIDVLLRSFILRATGVYDTARVGAPYLLGMMLRTRLPLIGAFAAIGGMGEEHSEPIPAKDYRFPRVQVDDLSSTDRIIRPLCDQAHQTFGREGSRSFNDEGIWIGRRA